MNKHVTFWWLACLTLATTFGLGQGWPRSYEIVGGGARLGALLLFSYMAISYLADAIGRLWRYMRTYP